MYRNIVIKGEEIYTPKKKVDNNYFERHFKKFRQDKEAGELMNYFGRNERYFVSEGENTLTMAIDASKKVIEKTKTNPKDIDMILFTSDNPEYALPTNAVKIHQAIGATNAHIVLDINANCIGMLTSLDFACRYAKNNEKIRTILLVGSACFSKITRKDDVVSYPNFSDGSSAVILEAKEENRIRGFIDSNYTTCSDICDKVEYPKCGYSNINKPEILKEDKKMNFIRHDVSYFSDEWKKIMTDMLDENSLRIDDIDHFLFSQFNKEEVKETLEKMEVDLNRHTFVGEKYGYTGVASPMFALNEAIKEEKIKEGSKLMFCSVGVGYTMSTIIYVC
ncbi:3-oxoacyl-[acyl-carrier-protein] synthase III C-terminal domain-containing protein [Anaeromicrobium sediminis]|nr:3-oxoacyl-[acyl-carrier-protein] synthase III C-terminal domain-containing protein [Anaeromicrobium sediminis]